MILLQSSLFGPALGNSFPDAFLRAAVFGPGAPQMTMEHEEQNHVKHGVDEGKRVVVHKTSMD